MQLPTSSTSRRGGYSYSFDLRLDPIRLDHVGALKRLSTEEHDLEDSQQTIDPTGKDVGNCKRLRGTLRARSLDPMIAATREDVMPARAVRASWGLVLLLTLLSSSAALAARTAVQEVPCEPGPDLVLTRDGTLLACRLAATTDLLVGPAAGNGKVTCSAGGHAEFHSNGYLSFCDAAAAVGVASYLTRGRSSTQCRTKARVAFDENGYLEYCS